MHWPQITVVIILFLSFVVNLVKDGQANEYDVRSCVISIIIWIILLYQGGFFDQKNNDQIQITNKIERGWESYP